MPARPLSKSSAAALQSPAGGLRERWCPQKPLDPATLGLDDVPFKWERISRRGQGARPTVTGCVLWLAVFVFIRARMLVLPQRLYLAPLMKRHQERLGKDLDDVCLLVDLYGDLVGERAERTC